MKNGNREMKWFGAGMGLAAAFTLIAAFQNCAPPLPDTTVGQASGASTRPTPLPSSTSTTTVSGGTGAYKGLAWEGTCVSDATIENMSLAGTDSVQALVAYTRAADGAIALWSMNSSAVTHGVVCKMNTSGWSAKALADLNGDGNSDIIWRNTDGRVAVWAMYGATRVNGALLPNMTSDWNLEATLDADGDGRADLVWRNKLTGEIKIWLMNGVTVVSQGSSIAVPTNYHILGTGDFDGDFKGDILFRSDAGALSIMYMNGTTLRTTQVPSIGSVGANYIFKGIGDFDADGKADVLWQDSSTNALVVWKGNNGVMVAKTLAAPDPTWTFELVNDIDHDRQADWLWTIPSTGGPVLGMTKVVGGLPQGTTLFNYVRTGWTMLKNDRL